MASVIGQAAGHQSIEDEEGIDIPHVKYTDFQDIWAKNRAIIAGEKETKEYDKYIDTNEYSNILLPFSNAMSQAQYRFLVAEGELPGICSQYASALVGGLLRKGVDLEFPANVPDEAQSWILDNFTSDKKSLINFLDNAIFEELNTNRSWMWIDIPEADEFSIELGEDVSPFPSLLPAESVINWKADEYGLTMVIVHDQVDTQQNEFHPTLEDRIVVHDLVYMEELDRKVYRLRQYKQEDESGDWVLVAAPSTTTIRNEPIDFIPLFPLNDETDPLKPMLTPLVDREINLYNKITRRNHLLYGASTYTPIVFSDMSSDDFDEVVDNGLGSWLLLGQQDKIDVLSTPTGAIKDIENAIASTVADMAKLGIRMLAEEKVQSGVALDIRNASQTARLGLLSNKLASGMSKTIAIMLNWKYDLELTPDDIGFSVQTDFNPKPVDEATLRLLGEWYGEGLISRETFISALKANSLVPTNYDDEEAVNEINDDDLVLSGIDKNTNNIANANALPIED